MMFNVSFNPNLRIGLLREDKGNYPNLALMKLSAYFKKTGFVVEAWHSGRKYDIIFASKVFTWSKSSKYIKSIKGGSGNSLLRILPPAIEHICPDYSLYNVDCSYGFLTRGCLRKCKWCVVPKKEGKIKKHADIEEFLRHDRVILFDNNVLAHPWGIKQIEKMIHMDIRVDFNQGIDSRLIDKQIARKLAKLKWIRFIRLACDTQSAKKKVKRAAIRLRKAGYHREIMAYTIITDDIEEALDRIHFLKSIDVRPYAQPFRSIDKDDYEVPLEQKEVARWVNCRPAFYTVPWEKYKADLDRKAERARRRHR